MKRYTIGKLTVLVGAALFLLPTLGFALGVPVFAKTFGKEQEGKPVVYKEVFFGSEQRKPQVGDQVWANQPLIILPDISRMVVETKVRETDIHKVERNQKVTVRVEAYPDLRKSLFDRAEHPVVIPSYALKSQAFQDR